VQVFDFNHEDDHYYMVLEYVTGQSLQEKLRTLHEGGQRLSHSEVARLMTAICEAVQYAHERGLIHRDIKPANVMLNNAGQPILMDFGVAKIMGAKNFTATGAVIGTPAYIAPELVRGQRPDVRADVYSLGVMLFEMLAGQLPFDADSAMSLMMMHLTPARPGPQCPAPAGRGGGTHARKRSGGALPERRRACHRPAGCPGRRKPGRPPQPDRPHHPAAELATAPARAGTGQGRLAARWRLALPDRTGDRRGGPDRVVCAGRPPDCRRRLFT
jgi:serine/threonine protein kinase